MPSNVVRGIAKKSGKSVPEVEAKWEKAKKLTAKQYPHLGPKDDRYWAIVNSLTHKLSGVKESYMAEANLKDQHPNSFSIDKTAGHAFYDHPDKFTADAQHVGAIVKDHDNGVTTAHLGADEIGRYSRVPVSGLANGYGKIVTSIPSGAAPSANGNDDIMGMQGNLASGADMDAVGIMGEGETLTEGPGAHLSAKRRSDIAKKAKKGKDVGHGHFKDVAAKAAKEYGSKKAGERVAAAAMWKHAHEGVAPTEDQLNEYVALIGEDFDLIAEEVGEAPVSNVSAPAPSSVPDSEVGEAPRHADSDRPEDHAVDMTGVAPNTNMTRTESISFLDLVTEELAAIGDTAVVMQPFSHADYFNMIGDLTAAEPEEVATSWNEAAAQIKAAHPDIDTASDEFNALVAMEVLATFDDLNGDEGGMSDEEQEAIEEGIWKGIKTGAAIGTAYGAASGGALGAKAAGLKGAAVGAAGGALVSAPAGAAIGAGVGAIQDIVHGYGATKKASKKALLGPAPKKEVKEGVWKGIAKGAGVGALAGGAVGAGLGVAGGPAGAAIGGTLGAGAGTLTGAAVGAVSGAAHDVSDTAHFLRKAAKRRAKVRAQNANVKETVAGAIAGGAIGAVAGGALGHPFLGAAAGGGIGSAIGDHVEDEDEKKDEAFAPGVAVSGPAPDGVPVDGAAEAPARIMTGGMPEYKNGKLVLAPVITEMSDEEGQDLADEDKEKNKEVEEGVFSKAGKSALVGGAAVGGIGYLAGGPVGGAIGAGLGGATGAALGATAGLGVAAGHGLTKLYHHYANAKTPEERDAVHKEIQKHAPKTEATAYDRFAQHQTNTDSLASGIAGGVVGAVVGGPVGALAGGVGGAALGYGAGKLGTAIVKKVAPKMVKKYNRANEGFAPHIVDASSPAPEGHPDEHDDSAPVAHKDEDNDFPEYKAGTLVLSPNIVEEAQGRKYSEKTMKIHDSIRRLTALRLRKKAMKKQNRDLTAINAEIAAQKSRLNSARGA